ncbi:acyl-CoA dehydrogenase [Vineibacter terrae]|uniref:Acyl-CoA dehydrogenase n=1 Tax=Vineibacter terrae TaxID=2586908 RepID=A0A5C8P8B5_9HYPH|nr:acyl-CoA dehydrogenase family protein [Vineibacter terrae]TXL69482.1 acyl-CoA dehydrogenase [Vineibacter terrae]
MTDPEIDRRCRVLREEVRDFLREEIRSGAITPQCDAWLTGFDPAFTRRLARRGWMGMTWPKAYGGHERSQLERFVVIEELLAAGAPTAAHHTNDRQVGPMILRCGTEQQKQTVVAGIARGECVVAIGLSEPDTGSDLASVRTRASRIDGGWRISGSKIWTSYAHHAQYLIALCRTGESREQRHVGLTQFIIRLPDPRVRIRPIKLLTGGHHFNQVFLDDVEVSDDDVLGEVGGAWAQISAELALERSGPERFLSTFPLLSHVAGAAGASSGEEMLCAIGELTSQLWSLRSMSMDVARMLEAGRSTNAEAAMVKDLGTRFEGDVPERLRAFIAAQPTAASADPAQVLLAQAILQSPGYTLRGGANEILRGIVARDLGLR